MLPFDVILCASFLIALLGYISFLFIEDVNDSPRRIRNKVLCCIFFWPFILTGIGIFYVVLKPLLFLFKGDKNV